MPDAMETAKQRVRARTGQHRVNARRARWTAITIALGASVSTATAHAADRLEDFCSRHSAAALASPGDVSAMVAAAKAETMLSAASGESGVGDAAIAMLDGAVATAPPTGIEAQAAVCTAAGEAYRISNATSPFQAQRILLDVFAAVAGSSLSRPGSLAAYRLSLLNLGPSAQGSRSARRAGVRRAALTGSPAVPALDSGPVANVAMPAAAQGTGSLEVGQADTAEAECHDVKAAQRDTAVMPGQVALLRCAAALGHASGDSVVEARALLRLARYHQAQLQRRSGEAANLRDLASQDCTRGLAAATAITDLAIRTAIIAAILEVALAVHPDAAMPAADAALLTEPVPVDRDLSARVALVRARLALAHDDRASALADLRQAVRSESLASLPLLMPGIELALAQAEPAAREAHVRAAFRALNAIRPVLPRTDPLTDESYFESITRPVFEELVDILLERVPEGANLGGIREVQEVIEEYRQAELQSVLGRDCIPTQGGLRALRLKPGELLLYPVLLKDRIELIYARAGTGGRPEFVRLAPQRGIGKMEIADLVGLMARSIGYGTDDSWKAPARRLYDVLIAPIATMLDEHTTLVVVPSQELSQLPFPALMDAQEHFLLQRARIAVIPALAYVEPARAASSASPVVLAASLEKAIDLPAGRFPALTGTGKEAQSAVADPRAGHRQNILLTDFDETTLQQALSRRRIDVLHLATHASFNGGSSRAFIVSSSGAIPISRLRDMIERTGVRGNALDLLILSACETAVGDEDERLGLAGTAVQAGAHSVIASLWQVSDNGTRSLMQAFYERFRKGEGKAEALRGAQLAMIDAGGELADPSVWASLALVGGWR